MRDPVSNSPSGQPLTGVAGPQRIQVRCIVLLAGSVSAGSIASRVGRSVLDLPLEASLRLLDVWRRRIEEFLGDADPGRPDPDVVILADEATPTPIVVQRGGGPRWRVARDGSDYRGTAGALRDLCDGFRDDDHVLVGSASQCPDEGLLDHIVAESRLADGVTLGSGGDGAPSGLMVVRCGALRDVPAVGYIDFKQQALPRIAASFGVRVVESPGGVTPPIRSLRDYLDAVRSWRRSGSLRGPNSASPFEERWMSSYSVIEEGAEVAPTARLHDSVVLAGGVVHAGAEVVRSVVGPRGVVRRSARVLDQLVVGREGARPDPLRRPARHDR